jgi:aminoglycoside 6'-N-acetyltransferase I
MVEPTIAIVPLMPAAVDRWAMLRHALWPDASAEEHAQEAAHLFARADDYCVLLANCNDNFVGFAEAALRRDYVNGCDTSPLLPVAFLEGIFVRPAFRRRGIARQLCDRIAAWARVQGAREFASDAVIDNTASHAMHRALGFTETEHVVFFRRDLSP